MLGSKSKRRRKTSMLSPTAAVRRKSFYMIFSDDRFWRDIMYIMYLRRAFKTVIGKKPEPVALEKLKAGQSLRISAIPASRRGKGRHKR